MTNENCGQNCYEKENNRCLVDDTECVKSECTFYIKVKLDYEDIGEIAISECDDMNIPINCFLTNPLENDDKKWHWVADNYMPRKSVVVQVMYEIISDSKEDILKAIKKYVIPFYENAINNLKTSGTNYYWEKN